jgi:hypothetical protein
MDGIVTRRWERGTVDMAQAGKDLIGRLKLVRDQPIDREDLLRPTEQDLLMIAPPEVDARETMRFRTATLREFECFRECRLVSGTAARLI